MSVYWTATVLLCAFLALSAASYLLHQTTIRGIRTLGFPDYFRIQLAILKLAAIPVLLFPEAPNTLQIAAYAGVAFFLITAMVAHFAHRDPIWLNLINVVLLGMLSLSYLTRAV